MYELWIGNDDKPGAWPLAIYFFAGKPGNNIRANTGRLSCGDGYNRAGVHGDRFEKGRGGLQGL
jgi:hypothetical protein